MSFETDGYVNIWWTNASKDAEFHSWRLYRRLQGTTENTLLAETLEDVPLYEYHDWLVGSNYTWEYAVVQVATRFGSLVESTYNWQAVTPISTHYWLIDEYDESNNLKLRHVISDSYADEYETEEMLLINRGRHVDIGEHWGVKGTLTAQLRDDEETGLSARDQRLQLQQFRERRDEAWLRTPFGDWWRVGVHNIDFDRESGVGLREYGSVTIPYSEVSRDA